MKKIIHNDWQDVLQGEFEQAYYAKLHEFLKHEYATQNIHPDMYHIFQAFEWTPFSKVKVVILGQDPYHGQNQAHGLSFQCNLGCRFHHRYKISTKNSKVIWELLQSNTVI